MSQFNLEFFKGTMSDRRVASAGAPNVENTQIIGFTEQQQPKSEHSSKGSEQM
jgi:hypothetical protein